MCRQGSATPGEYASDRSRAVVIGLVMRVSSLPGRPGRVQRQRFFRRDARGARIDAAVGHRGSPGRFPSRLYAIEWSRGPAQEEADRASQWWRPEVRPEVPMASVPRSAGATPAMAQWFAAKAAHPDALVFFRMGDFYELFFSDAEAAAAALDIALTQRGEHNGGRCRCAACRSMRPRPISRG